MVDRNIARQDTLLRRITMRILRSVALLLSGSAVLVLLAAPVSWSDRHHLLPGSIVMILVIPLAPVIIAWYHAGSYFLFIVLGCELMLLSLKAEFRRAMVEAITAVGVCALALLFLYLSIRFNFH